MSGNKPTGLDNPDIVKYFSNHILYLDWLDCLDQPLSKTVISIPARSSSKRLEGKNIKPLSGLPLFAYSIILAKKLSGIDRVFVNTDSREYADIAEEFGAEVPFLRPKQLSGDSSSIAASNIFLTRYLIDENYPVNSIINLYPTSPFRNIFMLNDLVELLMHNARVTTCFEVDYNPINICTKESKFIVDKEMKHFASANIAYKTTGVFIGLNRSVALKKPDCKLYFHHNPIELIDIDTEEDFKIAEHIIDNNLYDFGVPL